MIHCLFWYSTDAGTSSCLWSFNSLLLRLLGEISLSLLCSHSSRGSALGLDPPLHVGRLRASVPRPDRTGLKEQLLRGLWLTQAGGRERFGCGAILRWQRGEASEPRRRAQPQGCGGQSGETPAQRPTCRGGSKSKAEPWELYEQRREREISPSSLRSIGLKLHKQLDVPASVEYLNRQRILPNSGGGLWEQEILIFPLFLFL